MARICLFLSLFGLLAACAEIVPLTGGVRDEAAPKPVEGSQFPEQGAVNYQGSEITVTFDEYFTLNDPLNTVSINPKAGKLKVTNDRKKLRISWDEPLQPNTTYIIQLDGTILDLNEKNDTIHQFVFSTGPILDTLHITGKITDAFSGKNSDNYTVCLFPVDSNPLTDSYLYASRSDKEGLFSFHYLHDENYRLFAFSDANKDRKYTIGEAYAYLSDPISTRDTNDFVLRAFKPKNALNKLQMNFELPGTALLFGRNLSPDSIFINGEKAKVLNVFAPDSLRIGLPAFQTPSLVFTYSGDTLSKLLTQQDRQRNFTPGILNYKRATILRDTIRVQFYEQLQQMDTSRIKLVDSKSVPIPYKFSFHENQLALIPNEISTDKYTLTFDKGALQGLSAQNDSVSFAMEQKQLADLCTVTVNCSVLEGAGWTIQLMDGKTRVAQTIKPESDSLVVFDHLIPGSYQLRCFLDSNQNGVWDGGDYSEQTQPEFIFNYVIQSKLRPNWEITETLQFKEDE